MSCQLSQGIDRSQELPLDGDTAICHFSFPIPRSYLIQSESISPLRTSASYTWNLTSEGISTHTHQ